MNMNNLDLIKSNVDCIDEGSVPKNRNQTEEKVLPSKTSQSNGNSDSNKCHQFSEKLHTSDKSKSTSNYFNDYF